MVLIVGKEQEHVTVDKALLCNSILFFNKAFTGQFKEAKTNTINLPEEEPEVVKTFVLWLYRDPFSAGFLKRSEIDDGTILNLFALAEKWTVDPLMNAAFEALKARENQKVDNRACREQWYMTQGSKIRFVPVIKYVKQLGSGSAVDVDSIPVDEPEFLKDALVCRLRMTNYLCLPWKMDDFLSTFPS